MFESLYSPNIIGNAIICVMAPQFGLQHPIVLHVFITRASFSQSLKAASFAVNFLLEVTRLTRKPVPSLLVLQ